MIRTQSDRPFPHNAIRLKRTADRLLRAIGRREAELGILLVDDRLMAELNGKWLGKPKPTNVISFPQPPFVKTRGEDLLGDVVISVETARREATAAGVSTDDRIEALLVHGIVHLLGFDHELGQKESLLMASEESRLIDILNREERVADLCINIDHVATVRQARGTREPDPVTAAGIVELAGADGIVVHLREDRRHIQDRDVRILRETVQTRLNLEMAATDEIISIACSLKPDIVTLVPEKREELTTEGGLDVKGEKRKIAAVVSRLHDAGVPVSLFVDPEHKQIEAAKQSGADCVEIHTGRYAEADSPVDMDREFEAIVGMARLATDLGLRVHAGHGLNYRNTSRLAAVAEIAEFSIGHAVISRAVLVGLERAVREIAAIVKTGHPL